MTNDNVGLQRVATPVSIAVLPQTSMWVLVVNFQPKQQEDKTRKCSDSWL